MREEFSEKTKRSLASRVGWKCSFPGCHRLTIGPGSDNEYATINLGEAAHIHAASPNGPRYDPNMHFEERTSITNAVWMCRSHAKLIDSDFTNYSAETLLQWKGTAEKEAYRQLKELSQTSLAEPTTLIALKPNLIFFGKWITVEDELWLFEIVSFLEGNIEELKDYSINFSSSNIARYIVIESQGDGREINRLTWSFKDGKYELSCHVLPKAERLSPHDVGGDIALGENFDLFFQNNDIAVVSGLDSAIQSLRVTLSSGLGSFPHNLSLGSFIRDYFWKYQSNDALLNRLFKIEISRLLSVSVIDALTNIKSPSLNFVNRVLDVQVLKTSPERNQIPVRILLEWGNGEQWDGQLALFVGKDEENLFYGLFKDWE